MEWDNSFNSNTKFADKYCSSSLSKQCSGQIMLTGNTRVPHDAKCYIYKLITCKGSIYKNGATKRAKFKT